MFILRDSLKKVKRQITERKQRTEGATNGFKIGAILNTQEANKMNVALPVLHDIIDTLI